MTDDRDGYTSSVTAWDGDQSEQQHSAYGRPSYQSHDAAEENSSFAGGHHLNSASPQPRSSSESAGKSPTSKQPWRDNAANLVDPRDTVSIVQSGTPSLVEPTFDENVLRALCELDVSSPLSIRLAFTDHYWST